MLLEFQIHDFNRISIDFQHHFTGYKIKKVFYYNYPLTNLSSIFFIVIFYFINFFWKINELF